MATYPERRINKAGDTKVYKVKAGQTVRANFPVKLMVSVTDPEYDEIQECAANTDDCFAISTGPVGETFAAGDLVECTHVFSVVEQVKVGTGGATIGLSAVAASDGFTDAPAHGTGSRIYSPGIFLKTGVVGDIVSLGLNRTVLSKA
jgi:hypothetical protein